MGLSCHDGAWKNKFEPNNLVTFESSNRLRRHQFDMRQDFVSLSKFLCIELNCKPFCELPEILTCDHIFWDWKMYY